VRWLNPTIGDHGTIVALGPFGRPGFEPPPPPGFNLAVESYNRIVRLMQHKVPVRLELELESELLDDQGHSLRGNFDASVDIVSAALTFRWGGPREIAPSAGKEVAGYRK